jgi:hypothetical protein
VTDSADPSHRSTLLRWFSILLRGIHLATVIGLGAALLGADLSTEQQARWVLISGSALLLAELRGNPQMLYEWSGLSLLVKLLAVAWLATHQATQVPMFWGIVIGSVLFAHAPRTFRHARWWG